MKGQAFISMMREDIQTHKDKTTLSAVVDVMEYVVAQNPDCEIEPNKNVEDCYKAIFEAAKKNECEMGGQRGCCTTPSMSISAVSAYLGVGASAVAPIKATAGGGTIDLEDFL